MTISTNPAGDGPVSVDEQRPLRFADRTGPHGGVPHGRERAPIQVGLLGCGTVGGGVLRLLAEHAGAIGDRCGARIVVRKVLVREVDKARVPECDRAWLTTDPSEIVDDPAIEVVVEVMGGEAFAGGLVERALRNGKGVVTANKALLAARGPDLLALAHEHRADLAFEGAVGGGIPIVRTLREAFASDRVESLSAIINGTCNYVLTRMREAGIGLDQAIREAQEKGYAEADPTLDTGGFDAAHKLVVLAMLAFGARVDRDAVPVEGIEGLDEVDHRFAERFGYTIKHLAIGRDRGDSIELRVHPALVPSKSVLANVSGVLNAVLLEGKALGPCLVYGRGAGDLPTAVSVVADVIDVARSIVAGVAGLQTRSIALAPRPLRPIADIETRYYLRFTVADQPGVMAKLAGALGDAGVSIEQIVQEGRPAEAFGPAEVVMITHRAREGAVRSALDVVAKESFLLRPVRLVRIEAA